ncbi:MAG: hypothetical protein AB7G13_32310, partial [Lautropia sp.]
TLFSDGKLEIRNASNVVVGPAIPGDDRIARIDVLDRSTRRYATEDGAGGSDTDQPLPVEDWQNCLIATSANGISSYTWKVGLDPAFVPRVIGTTSDPVLSIAPDTLSANQLGGDPILVSRRSGDMHAGAFACDRDDPHPGPGGLQAAQTFGLRYIVQVLQDFGNRFVLYSDGTVEAWGINQRALGIGESEGSFLSFDQRQPLLASTVGQQRTVLTGVAMLSRGEDLQQTRALVRSASAADDGSVYYWGDGIPIPRRIARASLPRACFIAGPYVVGCDGQLFHVRIDAAAQFEPVIKQIDAVPPIWRVIASHPIERSLTDPNAADASAACTPSTTACQTTSLRLAHVAIARDGTTQLLIGDTATPLP